MEISVFGCLGWVFGNFLMEITELASTIGGFRMKLVSQTQLFQTAIHLLVRVGNRQIPNLLSRIEKKPS